MGGAKAYAGTAAVAGVRKTLNLSTGRIIMAMLKSLWL